MKVKVKVYNGCLSCSHPHQNYRYSIIRKLSEEV